MLKSNRQPLLESQLRHGLITVKGFIRGLVTSPAFRPTELQDLGPSDGGYPSPKANPSLQSPAIPPGSRCPFFPSSSQAEGAAASLRKSAHGPRDLFDL